MIVFSDFKLNLNSLITLLNFFFTHSNFPMSFEKKYDHQHTLYNLYY